MEAFIKKHQYNYINRCLHELNSTFKNSVDKNVIETNKAYLYEKILSMFESLSDRQKELLDITKIDDPLFIDKYIASLVEYVYGMPEVTNTQLTKLFKKEKKLKLPDKSILDLKKVYLGWIDNSSGKLFIAYNLNGKLLGMACRVTSFTPKSGNICTLCNHIGSESEVAFVSPLCKTSDTGEGAYRSIGFSLCLDSQSCNERITSVEQLERILKDVNNIDK